MSKTRCANTVPTSVAHAPLRPGIFRVSTPTRASSPTRPGSSAFANRPTEKAEKTSGTRGRGGSIAEWMTVVQASARAITERRFSRIATTTHSHCTDLSALPNVAKLSRLHQNRPTSAASTTSPRNTRRMRLDGTRKNWPGSKSIGPLSSAARCAFVPPTTARSSVSRCRRSARSRRSRSTSSPTRRSSAISAGRRSPRSASPAPCSRAPSRSSTSSPTGRRRSSRAHRERAATTRPPGSRRRRSGPRSAIGLVLLVACEIVAEPLLAGLGGHGQSGDYALTYFRIAAIGLPAALIALAGQGYLRGVSNLRRPLEIVVVANLLNLVLEIALRLRLPLGHRGLGRGDGDRAGRDGRRLRRRAAAAARAVAAAEPGRR